jgi:hypothetical protein
MQGTTAVRLGYFLDEFSAATGKSEAALRADVARGTLPAKRWGRRLFIPQQDAIAFLESLPTRVPDSDD